MGKEVRKLVAAAVQMRSVKGRREENLEKADAFIREAAARGAELIVLPECAASGYSIDRGMWDCAEPIPGPTSVWLSAAAAKVRAWVGTGLVEASGANFYNSWVLAGPDGEIAGVVRKRRTEFSLFGTGNRPNFIDLPFGRVGIGICADNHYADFPLRMQEFEIDLMLMPHAWPIPMKTSKLVERKDVDDALSLVKDYASLYTRLLGVPAVFANQTGPLSNRWDGILGKLMDPEVFGLPGCSTIADSDGTVAAQAGDEEGVITAEVTLDASRKVKVRPRTWSGRLHPGNPVLRNVIMPASIAASRLKYASSGERKHRARTVSGGT